MSGGKILIILPVVASVNKIISNATYSLFYPSLPTGIFFPDWLLWKIWLIMITWEAFCVMEKVKGFKQNMQINIKM
jgi:hypothetical protein